MGLFLHSFTSLSPRGWTPYSFACFIFMVCKTQFVQVRPSLSCHSRVFFFSPKILVDSVDLPLSPLGFLLFGLAPELWWTSFPIFMVNFFPKISRAPCVSPFGFQVFPFHSAGLSPIPPVNFFVVSKRGNLWSRPSEVSLRLFFSFTDKTPFVQFCLFFFPTNCLFF